VQWCEAHHVRFTITADQTAPLLANGGKLAAAVEYPLRAL
jgi:hypothetical protein